MKPDVPTRDEILSTKTSIGVRWEAVDDGPGSGGYVKGYRLYSAIGPSAAFTLLYDGADFRSILFRLVTNLETGQLYRFKVAAVNFNGEGPSSDEMSTRACIAPS